MGKKVKRFLHSFFKIFIIMMLGILVINILMFGILYIYHRNKCNKEEAYMHAPGRYVNVDGHQVHIYETGDLESDKVLVFLHGGLSCNDSIAVQPLFDELGQYHLVYIDRSGYGYTLSNGADKDIDSILNETRGALEAAEISGPYYLIASESAGIEAMYWADKYSSEVAGIIGIDMNYPEQFENTTSEEYAGFFDYLMSKFCKIGGMRLAKSAYQDDINNIYSSIQKKTMDALASQRAYTDDMFAENEAAVDNASKVADMGWPENTKMLMILANPAMKPYADDDSSVKESLENARKNNPDFDFASAYNESRKEYLSKFTNVETTELSGPSKLYTYCPKDVAKKVKEFVENIEN